MRDVFCNTSPLQYLHQIGKLELLPTLFEEVQVAEAVAAELAEGSRRQISLPNIRQLSWATIRKVPDAGSLISNLGKGEAETIALGLDKPNALVVLDDGPARRAAAGAGLCIIGTVGVLLLAKERGHVRTVGPIIARMEGLGFRLSERVRRQVLANAHESA